MTILNSIDAMQSACAGGAALCIGMFDGVHRGHQALLDMLVSESRALGLPALALTFPEHPLATLAPPYAPKMLCDAEEKSALIAGHGVGLVAMIPFTAEFAQTEPLQFIEKYVIGLCRARAIVCGPDFRFGRNGAGDLTLLQAIAPPLGCAVHVCAPVADREGEIRSTRIRSALYEGDVRRAAALLGRHYTLTGKVIAGDKRGRAIGFPTANLDIPANRLAPLDGVYAVRARLLDAPANSNPLSGMMNIGVRPTFAGARRTHEVHLFDFDADIYDRRLQVEFVARVREEMRFGGVDALIAQLKQDREECRNLLQLG